MVLVVTGGIGSYYAMDYLIKVRDYGFAEAVETLTGITADWKPLVIPMALSLRAANITTLFLSTNVQQKTTKYVAPKNNSPCSLSL